MMPAPKEMNFAWTYRHAVMDSDLAPGTRHVLMVLSTYINGNECDCWPPIETLMRKTGYSKRAVIMHMMAAETAEWIVREKHRAEGQKFANNSYRLTIPGAKSAPGPSANIAPGPTAEIRHFPSAKSAPGTLEPGAKNDKSQVQILHPTIPGKPSNKNTRADALARPPSGKPSGESDDFKRFYEAYPRKRDRGGARKAWAAALKKAPPETIIAGAERFAVEVRANLKAKRTEMRFVPYPSTWLNKERWADEPDPDKPKSETERLLESAGRRVAELASMEREKR